MVYLSGSHFRKFSFAVLNSAQLHKCLCQKRTDAGAGRGSWGGTEIHRLKATPKKQVNDKLNLKLKLIRVVNLDI